MEERGGRISEGGLLLCFAPSLLSVIGEEKKGERERERQRERERKIEKGEGKEECTTWRAHVDASALFGVRAGEQ